MSVILSVQEVVVQGRLGNQGRRVQLDTRFNDCACASQAQSRMKFEALWVCVNQGMRLRLLLTKDDDGLNGVKIGDIHGAELHFSDISSRSHK
jgi:hypothetical protein